MVGPRAVGARRPRYCTLILIAAGKQVSTVEKFLAKGHFTTEEFISPPIPLRSTPSARHEA
eukprot:4636582-Pyramimonas_sp.AAC.1